MTSKQEILWWTIWDPGEKQKEENYNLFSFNLLPVCFERIKTYSVSVWKTTDDLISAKSERMNEDNRAQLLAAALEQRLYEMKEASIEVDDFKKTVKFLIKSSEYLKELREGFI